MVKALSEIFKTAGQTPPQHSDGQRYGISQYQCEGIIETEKSEAFRKSKQRQGLLRRESNKNDQKENSPFIDS